MKKRELDIHYQGLIYLTLGEEENLVPAILGGENYDYLYPSADYEYESCYLGFLNENGSYENFADFEANHVNNALKKLKENYEKASSRDYFDSLNDLALKFSELKQAYEKLKETSKKIDYKKDPAKSYLGFANGHHEIIKELDMRFSHLAYSLDYENPKDGVMGKLVAFEPKPEIDYQSYLEFLDDFYKNKAKEIRQVEERETIDLKKDYESLVDDLKQLLNEHEKVGVAYLCLSLPKRLKSQEIGILDKLDIDAYLRLKENRIYWVNKH